MPVHCSLTSRFLLLICTNTRICPISNHEEVSNHRNIWRRKFNALDARLITFFSNFINIFTSASHQVTHSDLTLSELDGIDSHKTILSNIEAGGYFSDYGAFLPDSFGVEFPYPSKLFLNCKLERTQNKTPPLRGGVWLFRFVSFIYSCCATPSVLSPSATPSVGCAIKQRLHLEAGVADLCEYMLIVGEVDLIVFY